MMPFFPDPLSDTASSHLAGLQADVDAQADRSLQYERAMELWNARKNKISHRAIWEEIASKLNQAHPRPGLCQYCEYDRNSPMEHYYPQVHFPERSFQWDNYLLVCAYCNSVCKGTKFAVFSPVGSEICVEQKVRPFPPTDDAVLINPRTEDPQDYIWIDLETGILRPTPGTNARGQKKAAYTVNLLHLNKNDNLVRYRKKAYWGYLQKLEEYANVSAATDFPTLVTCLLPAKWVMINHDSIFEAEKQRILNIIKADILDDPFPSGTNCW
jgi:uncharacterized protein (TIGR02646 family)